MRTSVQAQLQRRLRGAGGQTIHFMNSREFLHVHAKRYFDQRRVKSARGHRLL